MVKKTVLLSVLVSFCFVISVNAQVFRKFGNRGGHVIKLEMVNSPKTQFLGLPIFVLQFEDKRSSKSILQKYDGSDSKPEVSTDIDVFEFVKTGLGNYMAQLGFSCSESSTSEITLVVTLDKFDVGYYSGKGWAANISIGLSLVDRSGGEYYVKEINKERVQIKNVLLETGEKAILIIKWQIWV